MKKTLVPLIFALSYLSQAWAQSPVGRWTTVDDKTHSKRAIVQIEENKGELQARIIKVYKQAGDRGLCNHCPGAFKDQPVQGLAFMWGLKDQGHGLWSGGHILDPKTGKIYKAKLSLRGDTLLVRAYIGIAMLGRTQVWVK